MVSGKISIFLSTRLRKGLQSLVGAAPSVQLQEGSSHGQIKVPELIQALVWGTGLMGRDKAHWTRLLVDSLLPVLLQVLLPFQSWPFTP